MVFVISPGNTEHITEYNKVSIFFEEFMDIHVVSPGDTIDSIAEKYNVSAQKILQDNELKASDKLVPGQTIVIVYPTKTYVVQNGDTLARIADANNISLMQLLRNNPFLFDREYIYRGETLTISYNNSEGKITTSGFAYPFINKKVLMKTLPYLSYLSIFNYTVTEKGEITTYYDDTEIVRITKAYGVAPLMLITSLSAKGVPNIEAAYDLLENEELQDKYINQVIDQVRAKGYYGVNLSFQYLNKSNQEQYFKLFHKISGIAIKAEIPLFITINPNKTVLANKLVYENIDYSNFKYQANRIAFLNFAWSFNFGPPMPISSIDDIKTLIDNAVKSVPEDKISIGIPILGYDWELPYVAGFSKASALSLDSVLVTARNADAVIEFDELSQTPYIKYKDTPLGIQHIIWFIDARTIHSLMNLVSEYKLSGTGVWNIMIYYPQMWLIINSQYEIDKVLPVSL